MFFPILTVVVLGAVIRNVACTATFRVCLDELFKSLGCEEASGRPGHANADDKDDDEEEADVANACYVVESNPNKHSN